VAQLEHAVAVLVTIFPSLCAEKSEIFLEL
jgi:hypothetical protein